MCIHLQKECVYMLKIPSEFGGLGKHQNNTACTGEGKKKKAVHSVEVGHCVAEEEMKCAVPSPRQTTDYQEKESP